MKKIIFAAVFSLATTTASANDFCRSVSELSGNIMELRQSGTPITEMMELAGDNQIAIELVLGAYKKPVMQTEHLKEKAIEQFSEQIALGCYRAAKSRLGE